MAFFSPLETTPGDSNARFFQLSEELPLRFSLGEARCCELSPQVSVNGCRRLRRQSAAPVAQPALTSHDITDARLCSDRQRITQQPQCSPLGVVALMHPMDWHWPCIKTCGRQEMCMNADSVCSRAATYRPDLRRNRSTHLSIAH